MQHIHETTPWSLWVQGTSKRGKHIFPMSSSSWHSAQARDSVGSLKAAWAGCAETHFALPTSYRCMVSCAQHRQLLWIYCYKDAPRTKADHTKSNLAPAFSHTSPASNINACKVVTHLRNMAGVCSAHLLVFAVSLALLDFSVKQFQLSSSSLTDSIDLPEQRPWHLLWDLCKDSAKY